VTPGYFATLGIPFLEGRDFTDADTVSAQKAIIISKGTAELLFPGHSAIGEQIRWGNNDEYDPWTTVIGVVGNTRWHPAERKPGVEVYWSYRQYPSPNTNLLVRTTVNPENMIETIRRVVREVNPEFAIELVKTMDNVVDESVWQRRLWGFVLTAFAGLALLLAAVGLYGVMSYLVEQRTRELGIRLAIGARPSRVVGLVLGGGLKLVSVGIGLGLGLAFLGSKYLARILFGVSATDPVTFLVVPLVLLTVALTACAVPAVRAASIDPLRALRQE
jgi:putative ABC transport system permease protein